MLDVFVFVHDPQAPTEPEQLALSRTRAAAARFAGAVTVRVLDLETDEALTMGAVVSPTIVVGDTAISVGQPPLAGQIKRFIEAALEGSV